MFESASIETEINEAKTHLRTVQERIAIACERCGRDASEVLLIGASKMVSAERLGTYFAAGLQHAGENYVQEGVSKVLLLGQSAATWHFIGALQRNKAREAAQHFAWIHSVDRLTLAQALNNAAQSHNKVLHILLQVNLAGEASKAGCAPEELEK